MGRGAARRGAMGRGAVGRGAVGRGQREEVQWEGGMFYLSIPPSL